MTGVPGGGGAGLRCGAAAAAGHAEVLDIRYGRGETDVWERDSEREGRERERERREGGRLSAEAAKEDARKRSAEGVKAERRGCSIR